jgi:hypothetical protein
MAIENEFSSKSLEQLKKEFTTIPHTSGNLICPRCETENLLERDKLESGGGGIDFVTTLYYCDQCEYFSIGERYWTTDY